MDGESQITRRPGVGTGGKFALDGLVGPGARNDTLLDRAGLHIEAGAVIRRLLKERQAGDALPVREADEDILVGRLAEFQTEAALGSFSAQSETGERSDG